MFTITIEFVVDLLTNTQNCPYLGIPIWRENDDGTVQWFSERGHSGFRPSSPSLDQIVAGKGYTPDNVELISNRANLIKCDATSDELLRIGTRLAALTAN